MNQDLHVHMLILMQNNLEDAIDFYEKLGFETLFHVPGKWAELHVKGVKIGLAQTDEELPESRTGIVLGCKDVQSLYDKLKAENIPFLNEPVEELHGIMVSVKDPGNNIFDVYQPTPEKLHAAIKKAEADAQGEDK